MTWVRLDDQFTDHPKIVQAGPLAGWLFVCGLGYAARYLTDGYIPAAQVRRLADVEDAEPLAARLVAAGLWEPVEGGYQVHDYLEYQPSRDTVQHERAATAQRVHDWREKKKATRNAPSNTVTHPPSNGYVPGTEGVCNDDVTALPAVTPDVTGDVTPAPIPIPIPSNNRESDQPSALAPTHAGAPAHEELPSPPPTRKKPAPAAAFTVTPILREWAAEHAPGVRVDAEYEAFMDWARANGKLFKDWPAAFRNWLRKAPVLNGHGPARASPTAKAPRYLSLADLTGGSS